MAKPDLLAMAQAERESLLDLLRGLTAEQWATTSLCPKWTVRDVAVHVVSYDELSTVGLLGTFVRGGLRVSAVNEVALHRYAGVDPDGVTDLLGRCVRPRGLTAGFGGGIALADGTIHHQDIRRALGLSRTIPEDQLRAVLVFALTAPTLPAKRNSRGLRLVATDLDWTVGSGELVRGPAEALLMALAGRPHALADLEGEGLQLLASRVGSN